MGPLFRADLSINMIISISKSLEAEESMMEPCILILLEGIRAIYPCWKLFLTTWKEENLLPILLLKKLLLEVTGLCMNLFLLI